MLPLFTAQVIGMCPYFEKGCGKMEKDLEEWYEKKISLESLGILL